MLSLLVTLCCVAHFSPSLGQQVRLVGGLGPHIGRLEIESEGTWWTVCDDMFGRQEARVVCRQLGYTDPTQATVESTAVTDATMDILLDDLECDGTESNLLQCTHEGLGVHNCGSYEQVGVRCAAPGQTGCLASPPCSVDPLQCPFNVTEVVTVPHQLCPICRCAWCPEEPPCPDNCKSGETEYYQGAHCRRCRCVPQELPDKIEEPNSISVALLGAVCVIALGVPLVCLVVVLVCRKKQQEAFYTTRQTRERKAPQQPIDWFGPPPPCNKAKLEVTVY